ncbi:hypothetical protein [Paenibacillus sp.]|uniref:hypothetical protein n=1 Tax=Paenibacillus sp. TaxID=58172 RepID=UPI00346443D3
MKTINELVKEAHQNAVNKGWWEEERTYGELIALVHSEVSEALEDYRIPGRKPTDVWYEFKCKDGRVLKQSIMASNEHKPCGIPSELADICIRIFDIAGNYEWGQQLEDGVQYVNDQRTSYKWKDASFAGKLSIIHMLISKSMELLDWENDPEAAAIYLAACISGVQMLCADYGIDLDKAIAEKMAYNATRPHRHGGKVL